MRENYEMNKDRIYFYLNIMNELLHLKIAECVKAMKELEREMKDEKALPRHIDSSASYLSMILTKVLELKREYSYMLTICEVDRIDDVIQKSEDMVSKGREMQYKAQELYEQLIKE